MFVMLFLTLAHVSTAYTRVNFIKLIRLIRFAKATIVVAVVVDCCGGYSYQQSDLSSSTSCCVSLPVSADGSNFFVRNCSVGDVLCVILLGANIADTGSVNGP